LRVSNDRKLGWCPSLAIASLPICAGLNQRASNISSRNAVITAVAGKSVQRSLPFGIPGVQGHWIAQKQRNLILIRHLRGEVQRSLTRGGWGILICARLKQQLH